MLVTGVASDKNTARISVIGVKDKPGTAFKIFHRLAKNGINSALHKKIQNSCNCKKKWISLISVEKHILKQAKTNKVSVTW